MKPSKPSVRQYMTPGPHSASPKQPLIEARALMEKHAIRHLPVQADGNLVGILSARDLELVWTLAHAPPEALTVEDAMTPEPYAVRPDIPLEEVVRVMAHQKIGSAVVVEREHVVGVFTSTDAMHALADILCARPDVPHEYVTADKRVRQRVLKSARLPDRLAVHDAVSVVMGALAKRLTAGEAHLLLEALPGALRSTMEEAAAFHEGKAALKLDRAELVDGVAERLGLLPAHAELVCEAVFEAVRRELPEKIVRDVAHQLPRGLAQLWLANPTPEPAAVAATLPAFAVRRSIEREIGAAGPLPPRVTNEDAFAAVMCTFSERLSRGQAHEVLLGLPASLRPLVDRCMLHRGEAAEVFGRDELLRRVEDRLHVDPLRADAVVCAVLTAVKRVLPARAVLDVASQLPPDLLALWERP